ncbi:MAG: hypothetical protein AAFY26_18715 [Cyanobacteria bacterium J06638_22]
MSQRYQVRCYKRGRSPQTFDSAVAASSHFGVHKNVIYRALDEGRSVNGWKLERLYPESQQALRKAQGITTDTYARPDSAFAIGMTVYQADPSVASAIASNVPAGQIPKKYQVVGGVA